MEPISRGRRVILSALGVGVLGFYASRAWARVWNPCRSDLPPELASHPAVRGAWHAIDPSQVWDCHAHLAGSGDSGSGIVISPEMESPFHPIQFAQRLFYLNAGCTYNAPGRVDESYVERMRNLLQGMAPGVKLMLLAFDRAHDQGGRPLPQCSALYVPNQYACQLARKLPECFEWVASIHPRRADARDVLEQAVDQGARAVKWLPSAMGIDPASAQCDDFYRALARFDLPLISHAGAERAMHGFGGSDLNNPLRLRRALDAGVRVVVAHCGSIGRDADLDYGGRRVASFNLFARMMDDPGHRGRLFGDISAIIQRNRSLSTVRAIIERGDWHGRLLNGTDYPLPGVMPLFSPAMFARAGMLDKNLVPVLNELHGYNPLLFDFVLKRHLTSGGSHLSSTIFETRKFFDQEKV